MRSAFLGAVAKARKNVKPQALKSALRRKDAKAAYEASGWDEWPSLYDSTLRTFHGVTVRSAFDGFTRVLRKERHADDAEEFDADARLQDWIDSHVASEVNSTYKDGRDSIRDTVRDILDGDVSLEDAADEIKLFIGLDSGRAEDLDSYRDDLVQAGDLTAAEIDREVDSYRDDLLDSRAETIASTEARSATTAGEQIALEGAVADGSLSKNAKKGWDASGEDPCPECDALDGEEIAYDDNFEGPDGNLDGPPAHPNCECDLYVVDE